MTNCPKCSASAIDSEVAMAMYDSSIGKAYEDCGCPMCKELDVTCEECPQCQEEAVSKQAPCWDGYVQRGMKPGADGKPVPNCIPVAKSDSWVDSPFKLAK
jgi:hypothetical protein